MSRPAFVTARPDGHAACHGLRQRQVNSVPIIAQGRLAGVVTARDLLRARRRARRRGDEAGSLLARDVMTRRLVYASPDESLYAAWLRMTRRGLRQLAVVDDGNSRAFVGLVTLGAIGRLLRQPIAEPATAAEARHDPVTGEIT